MVELARRMASGEDVLLATAVRTQGAPPCRVGQKILLSATSPLAGTLGCSELDGQATAAAAELLASGTPELRTLDHDLGKVETYLEPYVARPLLVVLGATPVAGWLLRWAPALGYVTALVEPRRERVIPELCGLAGSVANSPAELPGWGLGNHRIVDAVHTDHDAPDIAAHLAKLLDSGVRFVGVMGSSRHVGPHLDQLRNHGVDNCDISRIQSPVGLNLGGQAPAEMALSILAGLVAARNGRDGGWLALGGAPNASSAPRWRSPQDPSVAK